MSIGMGSVVVPVRDVAQFPPGVLVRLVVVLVPSEPGPSAMVKSSEIAVVVSQSSEYWRSSVAVRLASQCRLPSGS